jgi:ParB-like chromosome segregation protein Spo0J
MSIQITNLPTNTIKPYEKNARIHDDKHVQQIVSSIKTFKFTNPILVDEHYEILAGHGRYLAAKQLGMDKI